jgi:glycosyltransferase involved in cell wall biosynthesis
MKITVFTPTYNRGYIIDNLFQSLKRQTYTDFEWIVIDDGSDDDTENKFQKYQSVDNGFPIIYKKVNNGGKHRAINKGVKLAQGELFFIVDSDDYLTDTALEIIINVEKSIPLDQKKEFAGVCGLKGYSEDMLVGKTFDNNAEYLDITSLERPKHGIYGDKSEVFYTDILKKYPFPEFENENFITECVVWDKIAFDGYKLRFFNDIIYICDYLPDGLTNQGNSIFYKNPKGYGLYLYQSALYGKFTGLGKWNLFAEFFYKNRKTISFFEICRILHLNPINFILKILGLRLFYKIYR